MPHRLSFVLFGMLVSCIAFATGLDPVRVEPPPLCLEHQPRGEGYQRVEEAQAQNVQARQNQFDRATLPSWGLVHQIGHAPPNRSPIPG